MPCAGCTSHTGCWALWDRVVPRDLVWSVSPAYTATDKNWAGILLWTRFVHFPQEDLARPQGHRWDQAGGPHVTQKGGATASLWPQWLVPHPRPAGWSLQAGSGV